LQPASFTTKSFTANMPSSSLADLSGPTRCLIFCSKEKFDKLSQDRYGTSLVKKVVEYASGKYQKASLLGTVIGKHAFIFFDYDNPAHLSTCKVLGFRIKRSVISISVPAKDVHQAVDRWKRENERWQLSFPRQGKVCIS
jgi:hypothetical protein